MENIPERWKLLVFRESWESRDYYLLTTRHCIFTHKHPPWTAACISALKYILNCEKLWTVLVFTFMHSERASFMVATKQMKVSEVEYQDTGVSKPARTS
ncbi:hypothetical protein AOLI_G00091640 [Acnodon oligacanthus]